MTVLFYRNPSNRESGGACCDYIPSLANDSKCTEEERCDHYFTYCLRGLNVPEEERGCESIRITSAIIQDGAPVNFSQSTVLGLSNPFTLPGLTMAWMVRIDILNNPHSWFHSYPLLYVWLNCVFRNAFFFLILPYKTVFSLILALFKHRKHIFISCTFT